MIMILVMGLFLGSASGISQGSEEPLGGIRQALDYDQQIAQKERSLREIHQETIRNLFFKVYASMWESRQMESRLEKALKSAMEEVQEEYLLENFRMMDSDFQRIFVDQVIERFALTFSPDWEAFLAVLLDSLASSLERDLRLFAEELRALRMEEARYLPGVARLGEAFLPELRRAGEGTAQSVSLPILSGAVDSMAVSATGLVVAVALRKILRSRVQNFVLKRTGKAAGKKMLALAGGPWMVGLFALWTAWDVGMFVMDVSMLDVKVREELTGAFSEAYAHRCPQEMWTALAPGIREQYELAAITMKEFDRKVEALSTSRAYIEAVGSLPVREQERVAGELVILERETSLPLSVLAEQLSASLVVMNESHIYDLASMLQEMNPQEAVAWISLGGDDVFSLWRNAPSSLWRSLSPSPEAVSLLEWYALRKPQERKLLLEIPQESLVWIFQELSPLEQGRLFRKGTPEDLAEEVARLQRLPRGQRKPYGMASKILSLWDTGTALMSLLPLWVKALLAALGGVWLFRVGKRIIFGRRL
jgi:hypothetical protein